MIFNFHREGTEQPIIPISNDDRELIEETRKISYMLEQIELLEREVNHAELL